MGEHEKNSIFKHFTSGSFNNWSLRYCSVRQHGQEGALEKSLTISQFLEKEKRGNLPYYNLTNLIRSYAHEVGRKIHNHTFILMNAYDLNLKPYSNSPYLFQ